MTNSSLNYRSRMRFALFALALLAIQPAGLGTQVVAQTADSTDAGPDLLAATVSDLARELAAKPYKLPVQSPLGALENASPEDVAGVRFRTEDMIWGGDNLPFVIEPLHRSRSQPGDVALFTVEGKLRTPITYDPAKFEFGNLKPPPAAAQLGFTGFRVHVRNSDGTLRAVASIRNAAVLSAIARNQEWGAISRPLAVRSADQKSEEAPHIRSIWIEKPGPAAAALIMHALVDTPSLSGAFHFSLRADDATVIDVECEIFTRRKVEHFGLTPIQATHLSGPLGRRGIDDVRPSVFEVSGVQMLSGKGEWIWRPVANRERLQISAFVDQDPKGYGLLQRNRSFTAFLDDENAWQRRPTVWIEPIGNWGAGEVTLMEIPAAAAYNKNIALYWRPKMGLAARSKTYFAYRQIWSWQPQYQSDGAIATHSGTGRVPGSASEFKRRFLVQFSDKRLSASAGAQEITPNLWASAGKITSVRIFRTPEDGTMRIMFDLDAGSNPLVELRLVLQQGATPVSETWLYRWTP